MIQCHVKAFKRHSRAKEEYISVSFSEIFNTTIQKNPNIFTSFHVSYRERMRVENLLSSIATELSEQDIGQADSTGISKRPRRTRCKSGNKTASRQTGRVEDRTETSSPTTQVRVSNTQGRIEK